MIETGQSVTINAGIERVWDYVRDIEGWANLMPGLQDCAVINDNDSRWVLKVGAGGMVRTVRVLVHVEAWEGPGKVVFSYRLEGDPVTGGGSYSAVRKNAAQTDILLAVRVCGSGGMAPMWEAMGKPLLPRFVQGFAGELKQRIEETMAPGAIVSVRAGFRPGRWLAQLWRRLFGAARLNHKRERTDE